MVNRSKHKLKLTAVEKDNLFGIFRRLYTRFIRIRGNPREIALGFALGVFVGMSPTMGVQTPIAIFLAALLKWSKLAAAIGVWVSNPLTAPVLYGVTYLTGAKLLDLEPVFRMPLSPTCSTLKVMLAKAPQALGAMTVGGVIIGLPLAFIGYYLSYAAVEKYQKDVKAKLARRKAKLADTREKVKKMVRRRKIGKAGDQGRKPDGSGQRTAAGEQTTDDGIQMTADSRPRTEGS